MAPVVDGALAHERHRDRNVEALRERPKVLGRVPAQHSVAGQDQRPGRRDQQPGSVLDRLVGRLREVGLVRLDLMELVGDRRCREVLREFDVGRSRLL
jgi:hypothetical protein